MKSSKDTIISVLAISISLFLVGHFAYTSFFQFAEPNVDGISLEVTRGDGVIETSSLFSGTLLLIPILVYVLWKLAPINSPRRRIASVLVLLLFISLGIFVRHQEVKTYLVRVVRPTLLINGKRQIDYRIDPVNFVYYILGGLFLGLMASWLLLKQKDNQNKVPCS